MKGKGRSRQAILAAVTVLAAAQAGTAYASTGPASESGVQTGAWIQEGQDWKYQGTDGTIKTGWVKTESGWYYLDPQTGRMMTGWITVDGRRYYMNTTADGVEGQMRRGWWKDNAGKWYFFSTASDGTEGMTVTGWQWIDGKCYYFDNSSAENYGQMHTEGRTPDGYSVNADGQWVNENGEVQTRADRGYASNPAAAGTGSSVSGGSSGSSGGTGGSHSGGSGSSNNSGNNGSQNGGNTGDNGSSGNQNGGNQNGGNAGDNGSTENPDKPQMVSLVDETKTKLTEVNSLGWWLPIAFDEGYNADNTVVKVDGKDVTNLLTPITDDGRMAKLALLGTPGKVTVSSKEDAAKEETVVLSNESQEDAVYEENDGYLPEKILTHESVAYWDYYLTNYDENGKTRISPKKTTYNLNEEKQTHPSYSPDAVLPKNGKAAVTILFNYNTDEEKEWFDGIRKLELVEYDEQKNTINSSLVFDSEKNVEHGKGRVGQLTIQTGQSNFYNNGRYYVRVVSSAGGSALVPIHVVNETVPTLELKETPQSGKNLHFAVSDLVYAIETPIERVTLEDPNGTVSDLKMIDDWYLYSQDLFVLYNDNTDHLPYKGNYKITVYANGFRSFSKSFKVTTGAEPVKEKEQTNGQKMAAYGFDGISTASTGSSGSGSSSGSSSGSYAISANLIFDSDLLVNAHLLEQAKMENDASKAVMEWWYNAIPDAVFDTGDDDFFRWTDYVNKSENQKYEEDRMLPFADYRENGALDPNHPATAKEVLEDGLLGDIQYNGNFSRQDAPAITVVQNKEGEPVVLQTEDTEYIEAVQSIVVNGNWQALSKDKYSINKEAGTITIDADVFKAGEEYKLTVDATGYKSQSIAFTYDKVLENDLSLTVDYADDKEAFAAEKKEDSNKTYYFADAEFTVKGSKGDFLKNLKSVTLLSDEEDAVERNIYTKGVSSSNDVYYEVSGDGKKLILHQVRPGTYKLTLRSNYYTEALRCEFVVEKEEEEIKEDMAAPEVVEFSKHKASWSFDPDFGRASFKASKGTSVKDYLLKITSVKVGNKEYTKAYSLSSYNPTWKMTDADDPYNNVQDYDCIDFTLDGFSTEESTDVTIQAEGYEELTFTVTKDMKLAGNEEKLLPAPELTGSTTVDAGDPLVLIGDEKYLRAIKSVKVTGNDEEEDVALKFAVNGTTLTIQTKALASGFNEVVIEAEGYENQPITVTVESQKADTEIEVSSVVKESNWVGNYLLIRFNGVEEKALKTFLTEINSVEVNGKEYSKASVSSFLGSGEFAPHATDTSQSNYNYDCLKVSASGLSEEEDNEILIYTKNNGTIECKLNKNWKLIRESKTLLADEVLPTEEVPAEDTPPEGPKTGDENKTDVPDGDKKDETGDANKEPEVDEDKKEDSDESKDTSDEKKDETSDKGDADKDDSKDESGETGDDSKKDETDKSKDNDSKKNETGDAKEDGTSDKDKSDGGKGDASETEESDSSKESVSEEE